MVPHPHDLLYLLFVVVANDVVNSRIDLHDEFEKLSISERESTHHDTDLAVWFVDLSNDGYACVFPASVNASQFPVIEQVKERVDCHSQIIECVRGCFETTDGDAADICSEFQSTVDGRCACFLVKVSERDVAVTDIHGKSFEKVKGRVDVSEYRADEAARSWPTTWRCTGQMLDPT